METFYLILIILFSIILVGSLGVIIFFKIDEKNIKEVDTRFLQRIGKLYTKQEFENALFDQYILIHDSIKNENYQLLKDIVSDDEYNRILLEVKENREKNIKKEITNINKGFSRLISYKTVNNQEIVKLLVQYTYTEKVINLLPQDENQVEVQPRPSVCQYMLTFVKDRSSTENITCAGCGYQTKVLLRSKCPMCDSIIVSKSGHWVYVDKVATSVKIGN